ncbi:MAG: PQQ-binding-like beta-propeller repeat protein [Verrucomicrobiota bacterium]|nr:PQQ-binding-like beta-propeller repeat protein [Verrucomicrobiota bacterium]
MISYSFQYKYIALTIFAALDLCIEIAQAGDWPKWRGPSSDAYVNKDDFLPNTLTDSPDILWKIDVGPGHSAVVIQDNFLAISEEQGDSEVLRMLDKKTGKELWKTAYGQTYPNDGFGAGPRCTPLFDRERIYVQTCRGKLTCLRVKDGSRIWDTDYQKDFNVKWIINKAQNVGAASRRGYSGTPLVDGEYLICQVGSEDGAGVVCFNKYNGEVIWKSQNDLASYASPIMAKIAGKKQFITLTTERLIGINSIDGNMLWNEPVPTRAYRNVLTPVIRGNNIITASHSEGMICMSGIGKNGKAIPKWKNQKLKINLSTPVIIGDYLYGFAEKDRFICVDIINGKLNWEERNFGSFYASTLTDGKKLLVLGSFGELILINPDPKKYEEIGRMQACGKSWSFPAYSNGQIFIRDQKTLQCIKLINSKSR